MCVWGGRVRAQSELGRTELGRSELGRSSRSSPSKKQQERRLWMALSSGRKGA